MTKRRKGQFPRLAVYAVSQAELRRAIETVELLARTVIDLRRLVAEMGVEVGRLKAVPTPRRRRAGRVELPEDVAGIGSAGLPEGGGE